jgi:regulator of cell morphogenesis and NO signaling
MSDHILPLHHLLDCSTGDLVTRSPELAALFESFGINYCCAGHRSLREALAEGGVPQAEFLKCLQESLQTGPVAQPLESNPLASAVSSLSGMGPSTEGLILDGLALPEPACSKVNWANASLGGLVDHILATHHRYLKSELVLLKFVLQRVAAAHGSMHSELYELARVFDRFKTRMENRITQQEIVLFPWCRQLEKPCSHSRIPAGAVQSASRELEKECLEAGSDLNAMRRLTAGFIPPSDACAAYRTSYQRLAELERDTHRHVHEELHVLLPRAAVLQASAA